jgi:hypothetical protein
MACQHYGKLLHQFQNILTELTAREKH